LKNSQAIFFKARAQSINLSAFSGAINAGETYQVSSADLSNRLHHYAPQILAMLWANCQFGRLGLA
jgi:hypothetical protein